MDDQKFILFLKMLLEMMMSGNIINLCISVFLIVSEHAKIQKTIFGCLDEFIGHVTCVCQSEHDQKMMDIARQSPRPAESMYLQGHEYLTRLIERKIQYLESDILYGCSDCRDRKELCQRIRELAREVDHYKRLLVKRHVRLLSEYRIRQAIKRFCDEIQRLCPAHPGYSPSEKSGKAVTLVTS